METTFVLDALEQALWACRPSGTVHHSDKGSQHVSLAYTQRLKEAGLLASTGSTGDSYDNAMAESINGLYKAEVIHRKSWKTGQKWSWPHSRGWTGLTIDDCWKGWAISHRQKQKKLIMLPSETMIWQPEFTDKTLSVKPGRFSPDALRAVWGFEIQIQEQGVLVQRVLRRYGGYNTAKIQDYIKY